MSLPRVSVVVPARNEAHAILSSLHSLCALDYGNLEVLVVDGMSDDGTRAVVAEYAAAHPRIQLLDNPSRIVPTALNVGIRAAAGDVIARMDAHVVYPPEYLPRLVAALEE
ncbi:MAG: glycosyltransferase, partial [Patescibacteria group bacterium]|nr:glycosyltransferase [Patescibacteria group bacterium]